MIETKQYCLPKLSLLSKKFLQLNTNFCVPITFLFIHLKDCFVQNTLIMPIMLDICVSNYLNHFHDYIFHLDN